MERSATALDRTTWKRWRRAVGAFATSEVGGQARLLFAGLLGLLVVINGLNVLNSYVGRDFMTAIERQSMSGFVAQGILYAGVFAATTVAAVFCRFLEERLALLWREWLTRWLVGRYLEGATYYRLREQGALENPDQRIADDTRNFTVATLSLTLVVLNTTFTIVAFSGVLWSISPTLFAVAVGYAALGSALTVVFGRPLIRLNYDQSDREAGLRSELVHVRENAESVAFLRREGRLRGRILHRVDALVGNAKRIIAVNRNLGFFTTGYNYLIQLIPVVIVAPLFIRGQAEFGVISQSTMAFSHLLGAFSLVVTQFQSISSYVVVLARLGALGDGVEQAQARRLSQIKIDAKGPQLAYENLTLRSPQGGQVVLAALSLAVPSGMRVLVTGPNEAARIALFRATAGLWDAGEGRIVLPPGEEILFLPERPYLPPGTLREAMEGAPRKEKLDDAQIHGLLRALGAEAVLERVGGLDVVRDWDDVLSLGEQQLLSLAHLVLVEPRFALLDRPTTTLGPDAVVRVLDLLAAKSITVIIFATDPALAEHQDARLELANDGGWTWQPLRSKGTRA